MITKHEAFHSPEYWGLEGKPLHFDANEWMFSSKYIWEPQFIYDWINSVIGQER